MTLLTGLSTTEVTERRARGEDNAVQNQSRSGWQIIRTNLFSNYNNILFVIGFVLAVLGRYNDAFVTVIVGLVNALISTVQEIRAKRQLEKIAVVARGTVSVMRDGDEQVVAPAELVKDDLIRLRSGDQAVVDGTIVDSGVVEMDESLLTGEADLIRKQTGERILSGSFCVTGSALYRAEQVGKESYANRLTVEAQEFTSVTTPLQQNVQYSVNILMWLAALMAAIFYLAGFIQDFSLLTNVKATAVLVGLVPYGLFLTIAVAYALGATKIAQQGALVQRTNAVESLNNVDILCMDKTGTLTANELILDAVTPLHDGAVDAMLGDFVHSVTEGNTTNNAIAAGVDGMARQIVDAVPFSSARKWSALAFDEDGRRGVFVLGAIEMLADRLPPDTLQTLAPQLDALTGRGLRVLVFAGNFETTTLRDAAGEPQLPPLTPLALVSLRDKLRPHVAETLRNFQALGVRLKIISGDNPETVAALARQAGLVVERAISGTAMAQMSEQEIAQAAEEGVVFGRISPDQKQQIVNALIDNGHYVAMIGDGVNDVLSLKKAQLGIAMQSGSSATRNVADMVLLDDSYAALPPALREGKRIRHGIIDATYLLIGRSLTYALIIIGTMMVGVTFPFEPAQTGLTTFSVGFPAFCLTLWAHHTAQDESLLRSLVQLVLPYSVWTMLVGILMYSSLYSRIATTISPERLPPGALERLESVTGQSFDLAEDFNIIAATLLAQTSLSIFLSIASILFVLILAPPHRLFAVWRPVTTDRRPLLMVLGLLILFAVGLSIEVVTDYFGMIAPPPRSLDDLAIALGVWFVGLLLILKWRLFDRLLPDRPKQETAHLLSSPKNAHRLHESIAEVEAGGVQVTDLLE